MSREVAPPSSRQVCAAPISTDFLSAFDSPEKWPNSVLATSGANSGRTAASAAVPAAQPPAVQEEHVEEIVPVPRHASWNRGEDRCFSQRSGAFDKAVSTCVNVIDPKLDGALLGSWLLVFVNHWNMEQERIVLLCEKSVLRVKYSFVKNKVKHARRVVLSDVVQVTVGELQYSTSIASKFHNRSNPESRDGLRLHTSLTRPGFFSRWNPASRQIPYATYRSHILALRSGSIPNEMNVKHFGDELLLHMDRIGCRASWLHQPIVIAAGTGVTSVIHNSNNFGFDVVR
eukprot:gnl/Spiro4/21438_TR10492_c0_g1_i1.p1 gnl/Spiro4/21438_TR10492_c0_g1~~gnl/Spiro4/21438_TR10492_c0_g1_i1.p1  ORF type:complete len:287 (+),score=18.21 gnl/Spiro4/21438_TR10492_c0_g1_i1:123-983(+)